jgi:hypothetical protein
MRRRQPENGFAWLRMRYVRHSGTRLSQMGRNSHARFSRELRVREDSVLTRRRTSFQPERADVIISGHCSPAQTSSRLSRSFAALLILGGIGCSRAPLAAPADSTRADLAAADGDDTRDQGALVTDLSTFWQGDLAFGCGLQGPEARIDGTTPAGAFHGRYAWFAYRFGCGPGGGPWPVLAIREDADLEPNQLQPEDSWKPPGIAIDAEPGPDAPMSLDREVGVHYVGSDMAFPDVLGRVRFSRLDAYDQASPIAEGLLSVEGQGWSLRGCFVAVHEPALDRNCFD